MIAPIRAYLDPKIPSNYFRAEIILLRFCGIEVEKEETFWYKVYAHFSIFTFIFLATFVELYEFYSAWGQDIDQLANVFMYSMTHLNGMVKVGLAFAIRDKFKIIIKTLHEGLFKPDINRGGQEEVTHIRKSIKTSETMLIVFASCVMLVYLSSCADSVIMFIRKPKSEWQMTFLPISIINTTYSPMFEIGFIFQHTSVVIAATLIMTTDILVVAIIGQLTCQFKILKTALKNGRNRASSLKKSPTGREKSFDECFEIVMRDSVEHHLMILDLAKEMEELYNVILLFAFLLSVTQLCFMLYSASLVPIASLVFFKCLLYWIDISLEVFLYCYVADEVTTESVNVIDAASEMDWVGSPITVQKSIILVMARALRPVYITAGKFVALSLQTYMSIVKASFSYFMVLRQMNDEV